LGWSAPTASPCCLLSSLINVLTYVLAELNKRCSNTEHLPVEHVEVSHRLVATELINCDVDPFHRHDDTQNCIYMCVCVGVVPDDAMGYKLIDIFGQEAHAFRKYQRMMYWMPKFKFANPYYVPYVLPTDDIELAKMALKRMSVDLENQVTVHHVSDVTLFN